MFSVVASLSCRIAKMVTPPTKMHKLVKEPAAKNYVAAVSNIYNAYNSGDSNWQTKAMTEFGTYTEDMAAKSALSDNLNAFDKAYKQSKVFRKKRELERLCVKNASFKAFFDGLEFSQDWITTMSVRQLLLTVHLKVNI